ncbi:hypothetical protein [Nocardioides iriomotensis]|uniref:Uncharacterized protein n=1 Tax=Nocardioides iriomotensis TaxID=715784 RepID=A0A4Q5J7Z5_9ACTN|nr:hypothetical protein [Nocardioides iriomotensis]RYU14847.1 hypothetical protein ETU37_02350 [Nocardioides iriomotensis]
MVILWMRGSASLSEEGVMHTRKNRDRVQASACRGVGCFELATVRVHLGDDSIDLCPLHWQERRASPQKRLVVEKELSRPTCFKLECRADAVSGMTHLDGRCLPVCEQHLEDLSWVTPSQRELAALGGQHE